jgi:hypothetical protein
MTVPDAIGARYRSPAAQGLAGVAIAIAVVGYWRSTCLPWACDRRGVPHGVVHRRVTVPW